MATIILYGSTTRIYNAGTNDLMEGHNTSVTNLNNELITKLALAGGTMLGDINMDSHKITNLPAPVNNADAARKVDTVPAASSILTSMIADANVTTVKIADANVTPAKISHDNKRTKVLLRYSFDAQVETGYFTSGRWTYAAFGMLNRAFAVTALTICDQDGATVAYTTAYTTGGSNHYAASDKINLFSTDGSDVEIRKNGASGWVSIDTSALALKKWEATLELEFDD